MRRVSSASSVLATAAAAAAVVVGASPPPPLLLHRRRQRAAFSRADIVSEGDALAALSDEEVAAEMRRLHRSPSSSSSSVGGGGGGGGVRSGGYGESEYASTTAVRMGVTRLLRRARGAGKQSCEAAVGIFSAMGMPRRIEEVLRHAERARVRGMDARAVLSHLLLAHSLAGSTSDAARAGADTALHIARAHFLTTPSPLATACLLLLLARDVPAGDGGAAGGSSSNGNSRNATLQKALDLTEVLGLKVLPIAVPACVRRTASDTEEAVPLAGAMLRQGGGGEGEREGEGARRRRRVEQLTLLRSVAKVCLATRDPVTAVGQLRETAVDGGGDVVDAAGTVAAAVAKAAAAYGAGVAVHDAVFRYVARGGLGRALGRPNEGSIFAAHSLRCERAEHAAGAVAVYERRAKAGTLALATVEGVLEVLAAAGMCEEASAVFRARPWGKMTTKMVYRVAGAHLVSHLFATTTTAAAAQTHRLAAQLGIQGPLYARAAAAHAVAAKGCVFALRRLFDQAFAKGGAASRVPPVVSGRYGVAANLQCRRLAAEKEEEEGPDEARAVVDAAVSFAVELLDAGNGPAAAALLPPLVPLLLAPPASASQRRRSEEAAAAGAAAATVLLRRLLPLLTPSSAPLLLPMEGVMGVLLSEGEMVAYTCLLARGHLMVASFEEDAAFSLALPASLVAERPELLVEWVRCFGGVVGGDDDDDTGGRSSVSVTTLTRLAEEGVALDVVGDDGELLRVLLHSICAGG